MLVAMDMVQYLSDEGELLKPLPLSDEELVEGYRAMRRARYFDERAETLQRQGKLGVYPPFRGQEAAQVGVALALTPRDWLVPSYRESAAAITFGLPLSQLILYWRADPAGWRFPDGLNILPFYVPIATQLPQAVGVAHAAKLRGEKSVVATFVGDGGTSEGDFHEGLNFAAVYDAPVIFVVQNNGWAISVPTSRQMKNPCIADRAKGYGIVGVRVDGNDLVAVWQVAKEAVARARAGEGPTLIEAVTYRIAPHTTSDDPKRYRDEEEAKVWLAKEPVGRLRKALEHLGLWDDEQEEALTGELKAWLDEAVAEADEAPEPKPWEIVEHVFASMTPDEKQAWEALRGEG
jgi:pyruvate dehydrogenase E1 component alpha subunit